MDNIRHAKHDIVAPLINENCRVLMLGSMLSPKSAERRFYYAHPQNRFWRVLAALFDCDCPAKQCCARTPSYNLYITL